MFIGWKMMIWKQLLGPNFVMLYVYWVEKDDLKTPAWRDKIRHKHQENITKSTTNSKYLYMFLADLPKLTNTFGIHMFEKWPHWASVVCEKYHFCRIWSLIYVKVHIFWEGHKICEIFPLLLIAVHTVKIKGNISQNVVAFSEYINFISILFAG